MTRPIVPAGRNVADLEERIAELEEDVLQLQEERANCGKRNLNMATELNRVHELAWQAAQTLRNDQYQHRIRRALQLLDEIPEND